MKVPVFVYHAMHIGGTSYAENDLVAFGRDLATMRDRGFRVIPAIELVRLLLEGSLATLDRPTAVLTCDDGCDFDFADLVHPSAGPQRSILNRVRDFHERYPDFGAHVTSFVIVSPEARAELDKTCMIGKGWWNDAWWPEAVASGLMHIGNHSWDHNHDALPVDFHQTGIAHGTFGNINSRPLADLELHRASEYLRQQAPNPGTSLFAYPYGESSDYLRSEYLPGEGERIGLMAAFGDAPAYVQPGAPRWDIPRFVCGRDWKSESAFGEILDGAL